MRADSYFILSTRPLHVLVFLIPLLALYELGTLLFLAGDGMVEVIRARLLLSQAMDLLGAVGWHLPPVLLTIVLVCWHLFERDPWRIRRDVLVGMGAESFLWTLPLVVFAAIVGATVFAGVEGAGGGAGLGAPPPVAITELSTPAKLTLALGAGIYEELVFRLIIISGVHFLLRDIFKIPDTTTYVIAAIFSALAFTFYHNVQHPGGGADLRLLLTYSVAGLYFAVLFILRGFGIAVATHALYDVIALVMLGA